MVISQDPLNLSSLTYLPEVLGDRKKRKKERKKSLTKFHSQTLRQTSSDFPPSTSSCNRSSLTLFLHLLRHTWLGNCWLSPAQQHTPPVTS
ncbi:hypothetical protein E2C01_100408 [Portunus trituberculatus]|uniref:Uncharacterized protein n=1 Tax=Portunus trituberculatus TaxID=210409 RepID=A0A5B7KJE4_PORTR|nr:hypothetical protein [Portunus trituberculatus]